jgi:hypothetical protein
MRALALSALLVSTSVFAANPANPRPLYRSSIQIPTPRDVWQQRFWGPSTLRRLTAADVDRGIIEFRRNHSVTSGPRFARIDGHNASGQIDKFGFRFTANGQPLRWVRDKVDVYAFPSRAGRRDQRRGGSNFSRHRRTKPRARIVVTRRNAEYQWDAQCRFIQPAPSFGIFR